MVPLDEAVAIFSEELRACPDDPAIYLDRAAAAPTRATTPAPWPTADAAIRLDPSSEVAHVCRGNFLVATGDLDGALADFDEAIRLDPGYALAHYARGYAAVIAGRVRPRPGRLRRGGPARPARPRAAQGAGLAPGHLPRPDAPRRPARRRLGRPRLRVDRVVGPPSLAALAASHAASGDFDAAVAHQEKAASLRPEGPGRVESLRRLALYRDRLPYRDPPDDGGRPGPPQPIGWIATQPQFGARSFSESKPYGGEPLRGTFLRAAVNLMLRAEGESKRGDLLGTSENTQPTRSS